MLELRILIVLLFVVLSSTNTLLIKWTNTLKGKCYDDEWRYFQHPVSITFIMFLGQFLCFVIYKIVYCLLRRRNDGSEETNLLTSGSGEFQKCSMILPAFLNAITTVLLTSGIYLTYASSSQAISSSTTIFVALFSSIHLNQTLVRRHWHSILIIILAVAIIVSADMLRVHQYNIFLTHPNANAVLTGDLLIICASIFQASKMVYVEKYLKGYNVAILQALGWQGIFGLLITTFIGICMNFIPIPISPFNDSSHEVFDDLHDIFQQLYSNPMIVVALCIFVCTSAMQAFAGLCIIRFSSSANLIFADSICTYVVWLMACLLQWEQNNIFSDIGYVVMQLGLVIYQNRHHFCEILYPSSGIGGGAVPTNRPADII